MYDYDRRDAQGNPRALHIEKAMEVAELSPADCRAECADHLVRCPYFTVDRLQLEGSVEIEVGRESFRHFLVVDGQLRFTQGASVTRRARETAFSPMREPAGSPFRERERCSSHT